MKNLDVADINRKVAQIIEEVDQVKTELERVRLASTVTLQSIALPLLFAHKSFPKFSQQKYYIFSVSVMQAGVTCTSFLTTQLESDNWRKRTTTWRLNSQPTP